MTAQLDALAIAERTLLRDGAGISALVRSIDDEEWPAVAGCLASMLIGLMEHHMSTAGAAEQLDLWRTELLSDGGGDDA